MIITIYKVLDVLNDKKDSIITSYDVTNYYFETEITDDLKTILNSLNLSYSFLL
ncbi:hypothetical protein [Pseudostreptobacillus hongkongensis]|uniref:hypothetical protein n=1 Tax=Pseudostreptobacillus hongkongensis TaxID=1162717 RepID=UPI0028D7D4AD|nr:hypothetical protein [Pseudostreptobacillus hongkongensis]